MRKFLAVFLIVVSLCTTNFVHAQELADTNQEQGYTFIDPNLKGPFVKEVPADLKARLGKDYLLVRKDFVKEMDYRSQDRDNLLKQLDDMKVDLQTHRTHITHLEGMLADSYKQMDTLNSYIDTQNKEIERLAPTSWTRNKFIIGLALGVLITGGAMYGASKITK